MTSRQKTISIQTDGPGLYEFTEAAASFVRESKVDTALLTLFVRHTSCSLLIQENADPDVRRDLETIIGRLAPDGDRAYRHDTEGPDDMAAHARTMLTETSLTVPIGGGRLLLGTWQGIYLWEHRTAPHRRKVVVTIIG